MTVLGNCLTSVVCYRKNMDTNVEIKNKELEHEELIAMIKRECGYEKCILDIKTNTELDTKENQNSLPSTSIKMEPDNNITYELAINLKKEDEETLHEIEREELMLKTEGEDDNSKRGAYWKKDMKYEVITNQHDKNTIEKLSCKYSGCGYKTHRKGDLNRHLKLKHHENLLQKFYCDQCDYNTHKKSNMNRHILAKHDKCSIKKYSCNYCDYRTHYKIDLNGHLLSKHHEYLNEKYECDQCEYKTYNKRYLNTHVLVKHNNSSIEKYNCYHCDYKTHRKWNLNIHLTSKHKSLMKKISCDQCDYQTHIKSNLNSHVLVKHDKSVIKKYSCDCCYYKTHRKANLKRHLTSKHENEK